MGISELCTLKKNNSWVEKHLFRRRKNEILLCAFHAMNGQLALTGGKILPIFHREIWKDGRNMDG
jgi:hypothetical protein